MGDLSLFRVDISCLEIIGFACFFATFSMHKQWYSTTYIGLCRRSQSAYTTFLFKQAVFLAKSEDRWLSV
jgi:hypothetical protein